MPTQLAEQPRVLDGDDGLGGEVLHQLDLLVRERSYLLAVDDDGTDQQFIFQHRNRKQRPSAGSSLTSAGPGVRVGQDIGNVDDVFSAGKTTEIVIWQGLYHWHAASLVFNAGGAL